MRREKYLLTRQQNNNLLRFTPTTPTTPTTISLLSDRMNRIEEVREISVVGVSGGGGVGVSGSSKKGSRPTDNCLGGVANLFLDPGDDVAKERCRHRDERDRRTRRIGT